MTAGRPLGSKTPPWKNKAAIKVRIYRWLKWHDGDPGTRYNCAKVMGISRTTVVGWWDTMSWTADRHKGFREVIHWYCTHLGIMDYEQCANDLNLPVDEVKLNVATYEEMVPKYVLF